MRAVLGGLTWHQLQARPGKSMKFLHRFKVQASLSRVSDFHRYSTSLGAITPPPAILRIHRAPQELGEGDEMDFTIWLGPLPIRWVARIEEVSQAGFVDRQLLGPFNEWVHLHSFIRIDEHTTQVQDYIEARLRAHLLWGPVGLGMWLSMPLMFAYRARQTRKLLVKDGKRERA
jgi:ligand-binding SRPBCC domain-containing protein